MFNFVIQRLVAIIPVAFGVVTLVALLAHAVPGDPIDSLVGEYATFEEKQALRRELKLDQPVWQQLTSYYASLMRGDLGVSLLNQRSVSELIWERFPATAELAVLSIIIAICISIPVGVLSATFANTVIDYVAMSLALLGIAMPNFWFASMLILLFSLQLNLLPVSGRGDILTYILPSITIGTALSAILSRMTRNSMLDVLREDYIRTARAKGVKEFYVIVKHALRNAALPLVSIIGLQFGVILTGTVITELIFDWPGLGSLLLNAVQGRDYPLIQGCVLMFSACYLLVNLLTDIIYAFVDPRIKLTQQ